MQNKMPAKSLKGQLGGFAFGGRKFIYSISMAALFGIYVFTGKHLGAKNIQTGVVDSTGQLSAGKVENLPLSPTPTPEAEKNPAQGSPGTIPAPTMAVTPTPTSAPKGQYTDGNYTGSREDAYYGFVKVRAVVKEGRLADVVFLEFPNDHKTSRQINSQAAGYLTQEAISVQSANVDIISGATDTSEAFIKSLSAALNQAI